MYKMWWITCVVLFTFGFTDTTCLMTCSNKWIKVLQTNDNGIVEAGCKSDLIDAVLHGAELQVFVPDWRYASNTQQIDLFSNNSELCAQAVFHISKDSWESFHNNAYWYFLYLCTNGYVEKTRWYVGTHAQPSSVDTPSQTTSRLRIEWFVRNNSSGLQEDHSVYCNSYHGNATCGSLSHLVQVIQFGADIRAKTFTRPFKVITPFDHLAVSDNGRMVSGQHLWTIGAIYRADHFIFRKNGEWIFDIWSSNGLIDESALKYGSHENDSKIQVSIHDSIDWFADTCWMLAYQHDETGKTVDGTLDFLQSAIMSGHRVKILTGNLLSMEADNLVLQGHDISAQLLGHVTEKDPEHLDENANWYWKHVSISGKAETIELDVGSSTKEGSSNYSISASWFIDSRHWKHVLSTSKDGFTTFGSKTDLFSYVRKGSMLRCVIKFSQNHTLVAQADNIEFSPDGTNLGAQILRIVSYTTEKTSTRHFENVPYWKFTIVSTTGTVRQSDWVVGEHTTRKTDPMVADIDWFVN